MLVKKQRICYSEYQRGDFMITISNEVLSLAVEEKGAQMRSLKDNSSGREYLWQANPDIWGRTAPILFPAVGKVYTDGYTYGGKRYAMPKHGFARDAEFYVKDKKADFLTLAFAPNDRIREMYPFDFEFSASFKLKDRTLEFSYNVENKGTDTMYFSVGAHPGFNVEFGDKLIFAKKEELTALYYNEADRPNADAAPFVMDKEDTIEITKDFFCSGSLCFPPVASESVSLADANGKEYLSMNFGKVPHLWLWAKAGAPYVCIEPWHGADETVAIESLTDKKGIVSLEAGKTFAFAITVKV